MVGRAQHPSEHSRKVHPRQERSTWSATFGSGPTTTGSPARAQTQHKKWYAAAPTATTRRSSYAPDSEPRTKTKPRQTIWACAAQSNRLDVRRGDFQL